MSTLQKQIREDSLALIFAGGPGSLCGVTLGSFPEDVVIPEPFQGPLVIEDDTWDDVQDWVPQELTDHGQIEMSLTFEDDKVSEVYLELPSWDNPKQILQEFQKEWGVGKQIDTYYLFMLKGGAGFELNIYPERTHVWLGYPLDEDG